MKTKPMTSTHQHSACLYVTPVEPRLKDVGCFLIFCSQQ